MAVNLSFIGGAGWQFFDDNGVPLSGGKIYTYAAGTTTPLTTYTSRTGLVPNSNPIILDAAGRTPEQIWSTEGSLYKYVVKTSTDVQIRSWDNIGGSVVASDLATDLANTTDNTKGDALIGFKQSNSSGFLTGATARTVNTKLQEIVSVKDFGAVGDGIVDDTEAIQAAIDSFGRGTGTLTLGALLFPEGTYKISDQLEIYQQRLSLLSHNAVLRWYGVNTKAMLRIRDSNNVVIDSLTFLGNASTPPTAAIYFEQDSAGTVGTNEFCTISNVSIGRSAISATSPGTFPLARGIWIGGAVDGNNDSFYIDRCTINDCTTAGIAIDNNQSIWGSISNTFLNTCGYGIYTGSNVQCSNVCFNRNTVADLYAFRDITVTIDGFNSENAVLPISTSQGASIYINGGKIICGSLMSGTYWADIAAPNYVSLSNLQVAQAAGITGKKLRVSGTSTITARVFISQCRLPDGNSDAGYEFNFSTGTAGGYINVSAAPFEAKAFAKYRVAFEPPSIASGSSAGTSTTGSLISEVLSGDIYIPSFKLPLQDVILTGGASANSTLSARFHNRTSGAVDLASSFVYWRKIATSQIVGLASSSYSSPLLANGAQATTTLSLPTAKMGDFVAWSSEANAVASLLMTSAYVSAAGTVTVVSFNSTGGTIGATTATLRTVIVSEHVADLLGGNVYDPPNIASLAQTTTTISVPGAALGDTVIAAFSNDLQAITLSAYVSAADTVTAVMFNGSAGAVNLGAGLLRVFIYKQGY